LATICFITSAGSARPPVTPRDHAFDVGGVEASERQGAHVGKTDPGRLELGPERENGEHRQLAHPLNHEIEQFEGCGVRPVRVLEREQDRLAPGETFELVEQCRKCAAALLRGAQRQRRVTIARWDRQQRGKERRGGLHPRRVDGEERFHLVQALLGRVVCPEPRRPLQLVDDGTKRAVGVIGRALVAPARVRLGGDALGQRRREAGFADARFARDQHDLPFTLPGEALPLQ
jgi:hypothetical protein